MATNTGKFCFHVEYSKLGSLDKDKWDCKSCSDFRFFKQISYYFILKAKTFRISKISEN